MITLIQVAGLAQLILVVASIAIPKALRWPEEVSRLSPLNRHVFWTYALYIWGAHIYFGLISLFDPYYMTDPAGSGIRVFIYIWWSVRLVLHVLMHALKVPVHETVDKKYEAISKVGDVLLGFFFLSMSLIYGYVSLEVSPR